MASSEWYRDPNAVLQQVRMTGAARGGIPVIAGYDDLVEIKRGGQGVVFSATQRSTRRRVAIKLLLDGAFANDTAKRRFEREVDLVAGLRHPHIVQIFDSGLTSEGQPYFVMEYIDGLPLDQHVSSVGSKSAPSTIGADSRFENVLSPFLAICEAVQHAHQHGVIHRDLKPGNIRVDSSGLPRVLDFGLARGDASMDKSGEVSLELTQSGHFLGSLAWASPEHASGRPDAIDTRSDIYALGLILYFLLARKHPYPIDGSPRDVLDNILRAEPVPPEQANNRIDADLSTIVMKCLAKEPARRYQSVAELASDVRHYLAGEPIQARRDSMWYTLRKQARRYQVFAIAAVIIMAVVATGLVVSLRLWQSADDERKKAEDATMAAKAQRDIAEHERENAEKATAEANTQRDLADRRSKQSDAVTEVLKNILSAADPARKGSDVRVVDLLERAADDAARLEETQPEVAVPVRFAIGRSYLSLGLLSEARAQADAGLALGEEKLGVDAHEVAIGRLLMAEVLLRQGKFPQAESVARPLLEHFRQARGPDDLHTLGALQVLTAIVTSRGNYAEAAELARQNIEARVRELGEDDPQTLEPMNQLAGLLRRLGRLDEAQAMFEDILKRRQQITGDQRSDVITTMSDLAGLLSERDQHDRAIELLEQAVDMADKTYGADHLRSIIIRSNLAMALVRVKRTDDAIKHLTQVLETERRVLEPDDPAILTTLSNLSSAYRHAKQFDKAMELVKEAAESAPNILGPDHPNTLIFRNNYGNALMTAQRLEECEAIFRDIYEKAAAKLGEKDLLTAMLRGNLGQALMKQKRYDEAEPHLLAAYEHEVAILGADNERAQLAAMDLFMLYEGWGNAELAAEYRAKAPPNLRSGPTTSPTSN